MACGTRKVVLAFGLCTGLAGGAGAAEWSVAPAFSWLADHHSNRALRAGDPAGESLGADLDLGVVRRSETSEFLLRPHYRLRRFSDDVWADVDDKQLLARAGWMFERSSLNVNADAADQSTLTTELAETGFVRADSNRRTYAAGLAWQLQHSEENGFNVSLGWQDVDYTGADEDRLFGYRYATLQAGESFGLSTRGALIVSAFGSALDSPERGSQSREHGLSLGWDFAWTERTSMSLSLGLSRRDVDGADETGTTRNFSLVHKDETRDWSFVYSHSLVPFGTGVLTERDTARLQVMQALSPRLGYLLRAGYSRNSDAGFGVTIDSREYSFGETELRWQWLETWSVVLAGSFGRAIDSGFAQTNTSADGWGVALRTLWAPRARVFGH
jgi:hypothetical protein